MLVKPDISDGAIVACIQHHFGLHMTTVSFLPLGADVDSAVYRVASDDGASYLLKLRRGPFDNIALAVPAFLHARGIKAVLAPIPTRNKGLSARAHDFEWMLYPFFEGRTGFEVALSRARWLFLGASLKAVHATSLPARLAARIPRENFSPARRMLALEFDKQVGEVGFGDSIAVALAAFWRARRDEIRLIVRRAELLAHTLRQGKVELVTCHADLHAGNVLLGPDDQLAIVDWDELIAAPKERDLMFVGAGVGDVWNSAEEESWFYEGYGPTAVDPVALAYYRYERIVADIAAYAQEIFGIQGSVEDRREGLRQLTGQFQPGSVVEIAHRSYQRLDPNGTYTC